MTKLYDLEGFSRYAITEEGVVHNTDRGIIMTNTCNNPLGRLTVRLLGDDGKYYKKYIHRMLAELFIPNPEGLEFAVLKDKDSNNLSLDNIQWSSRAMLQNRIKNIPGSYTNDLQIEAVFISPEGVEHNVCGIRQFARENNLDPSTLRHMVNNTRNYGQHRGWRLKK